MTCSNGMERNYAWGDINQSQGWRTCGTRKGFLGATFTAVRFFFKFLLPDQRLYIVKNMCMYTHV